MLLLTIWILTGCVGPGTPLNSELIKAKFASYGVEIISQSSAVRVTNLYSGFGESKITRTFAVVLLPKTVPAALRPAHERVLAGGSLGQTLDAAGWQVVKHSLDYQTINASPSLAELMQIPSGTALAMHLYSLSARGDGINHDYVQIAEIHHPAHLSRLDLIQIYGKPPNTNDLGHQANTNLAKLNWRIYTVLQML